MSIEAMKLALEALELIQTDVHWEFQSPTRKFCRKAEKSLRTAIEQTEKQEPPPECQTEAEKRAYAFGWWKAMEANRAAQPAPVQESSTSYPMTLTCTRCGGVDKGTLTVPNVQRQWVGLTDEEIGDALSVWELTEEWPTFAYAARAIEAKLREKNSL